MDIICDIYLRHLDNVATEPGHNVSTSYLAMLVTCLVSSSNFRKAAIKEMLGGFAHTVELLEEFAAFHDQLAQYADKKKFDVTKSSIRNLIIALQ